MKKYGTDSTHLKLSGKALEGYTLSGDLIQAILEREDVQDYIVDGEVCGTERVYSYDVKTPDGVTHYDTEAELIAQLEEYADLFRACEDEADDGMTPTQFALACSEAPNYSDPDAFVSDLLTSSAFAPADPEAELDLTQADALRRIWTAAAAPFRDLLRELGLGQTELARRYQIPLRTVQDWAAEKREPPMYTRLMIARLEGYLSAPEA